MSRRAPGGRGILRQADSQSAAGFDNLPHMSRVASYCILAVAWMCIATLGATFSRKLLGFLMPHSM
jgi:hypothetical protein